MGTIIYFLPMPETCECLKKLYRKLAMKHHPDAGGDTETMKAVNAEYEVLFFQLKDVHKNAQGEKYTAHKESSEVPEDFIAIINILIRFENVQIEIIGQFIWVSGDTKPYRDILKEQGFKWHSQKHNWYLAPTWYVKFNRKRKFSMDDIRNMWGTQDVETQPMDKLEAVPA